MNTDLLRIGPGVYRMVGDCIKPSMFDFLKSEAERAPLLRARICVHGSTEDKVQEMFVCLMRGSPKGTYRYPRPASFLLLEGAYSILLEDGRELVLNDDCRFVRVPALTYQTPTIESDYVLLHEIHTGPWTPQYVERKP